MAHDLEEMAFYAHSTAVDHGFWDQCTPETETIFYANCIAKINSEACEALEAILKRQGDEKVVEELADTIIRVMDLWAGMVRAGYTRESLLDAITAKMERNVTRPHMHGNLG